MRFSVRQYLISIIILLSILEIGVFIFYKISQNEIHNRNRKENELMMKKMPKEISQNLQKYATPSATFRVPILVYHYVEIVMDKKDKMRKSLSTPPYIFEKQIQTLKDAGYTFITPSLIGEVLDGKAKMPPRPIVLSFDDGYRDFYTDVFPILQKNNVKAVEYVVPGFLDKINYLYTWQLDNIYKSGLIEIGAHTIHHIYLKGANPKIAQKEIQDSKKMLEDHLHTKIVSFAYPYGAFDTSIIDMVKHAGYTTAVSEIGGEDVNQKDRYFLYRIHPGYAVGNGLLALLNRPFPTIY